MLTVVAGIAARFVGLLAIALVPWGAPLDPRAPSDPTSAMVVIALALAIAAGGFALVARVGRARRALGTALALPFVLAALGALLFDPSSGPLAQGVWLVGPALWVALAMLAHAMLPERARTTTTFAVIAFGAASYGAARNRLGSRDAMWSAMLAADPSDAEAATAIASVRDAEGRTREALAILRACAEAGGCACAVALGERELRAPGIDALADLLAAHETTCSAVPGYGGLTADVLARAGRAADAEARARHALVQDPGDVHAMFAMALTRRGTPEAARAAERADAARYGDDATLLVGIADLDTGDLARAAQSFQRVLAHDPSHAGATYDLALVADRQGNYHDAREGYLAALRLDPSSADARYNLALLTYRAGALPEARHHADELARIAPDDPRLPALRATLGSE